MKNIKFYLAGKLNRQFTNEELAGHIGIKARRFGDLLNSDEIDMAQAAAILRGVGLAEVDVVAGLIDLEYLDGPAVAEAVEPGFTRTESRKEVRTKRSKPKRDLGAYGK